MSKTAELIKKGENKTLEFKSDLPVGTGLAKSAVAFSNMAGGLILIGVADGDGTVTGLTDEQILNYPDRITNILFDSCHPAIIPEIFTECMHGKMVLGIKIHPGPLKPYLYESLHKLLKLLSFFVVGRSLGVDRSSRPVAVILKAGARCPGHISELVRPTNLRMKK